MADKIKTIVVDSNKGIQIVHPKKWISKKKKKESNKIDRETSQIMKDQINEWKRKRQSKKLEEGIEKAGYSSRSLDEVKSGSKIGSIDTAGRIRQGIKKGGRVGFSHGGSILIKGQPKLAKKGW